MPKFIAQILGMKNLVNYLHFQYDLETNLQTQVQPGRAELEDPTYHPCGSMETADWFQYQDKLKQSWKPPSRLALTLRPPPESKMKSDDNTNEQSRN